MSDYIMDYAEASGGLIKIEGIIPNKIVEFFAFVTSFSDTMTSNWNEEQVYGRQDPIGTFQSTTRKISLNFDLPAVDIIEAKLNLDYINQVRQFMYPAYSTAATEETTTNALSLAKSPLVRMRFANLIKSVGPPAAGDKSLLPEGLLGWIESFSATPVIDMGMFSQNKNLFPKVYNVSISFTPQHEFDLGYDADGKPINENFTKFPYDGGR